MKKTALTVGLGLSMAATAGSAHAQLPGFNGTYTADITCEGEPVASIDAILAAQAPYLKRGPTTMPAGKHPMCTLALRYDLIVFGGLPTTSHPLEVAKIIIDLEDAPGAVCANPHINLPGGITIPAPPPPAGKRSFIPLMHQNDPTFVVQSKFGYGYNAFEAIITRAHTPGVITYWTGIAKNPGQIDVPPLLPDPSNQMTIQAQFFWRTGLNATGLAALPSFSASLDAPVYGNTPLGKAYNIVLWGANASTVQSQTGNVNFTSSVHAPYMNSAVPGINNGIASDFTAHFEAVNFTASLPVNCL